MAEQDYEYLKKLTVLYVEDDADLRGEMAIFLGRLVGTLFSAENGEQGLAVFREQRPQLVVTDLLMPGISGLEMAREIRRLDSRIPIVVTTAFEQTNYLLQAIEIGIDKYVTKPIAVERLVAALLWGAHQVCAEEQLELQYQRETALLRQAQERLTAEVAERTAAIGQANSTLRKMLKSMEQVQGEFEEKVAANIFELVEPYLHKLKKSGLDGEQTEYVESLETNLQGIVSPLVRTAAAINLCFTPAELRIANLVKQGRSTKEISELLNLSPRTVEKNRQKIRKKIGITNQKSNLTSVLSASTPST